ncbi:MAG: hypothetical protein E7Z83_02200 [Methanobrevibacter sp.]|nr:CDP-glycerol glycerophosphotransferase family protein [Methanobrevibacter sp.]MBE6489650.1 hypothetical protein [Methanobrevibacter sp.]
MSLDEKYSKIFNDITKGNLTKYDKNIKSYPKIKDSENFDSDYYVSQYNLKISKKYALLHYLDIGFKENKNPSEEFNGKGYFKSNPDVKKSGWNPLTHYELYGKKEGRSYPLNKHEELKKEVINLKNSIYQNRILTNVNLLRNKIANGKKANVIFILPAMMFVYKELYKLFEKDNLFNVQIVLVPHRLGNGETITKEAKDKYFQILNHLEDENYNVINGYNFDTNRGIDLETTCKPDIVFYILPYMRIYPKNMEIDNLPNNILYAYIPYGEFIESDLDDNLYNFGWNEKIWKIFCSTEEYLMNSSEKSPVGSSNVVLVGSARMDSLINFQPSSNDYNWISKNKKRIIWSPHHSLSRPGVDEKISYSTFDDNFNFFYEYAKNNQNIEWVLRPHPLLKEILNNINTNMKLKGLIDEDFVDDYFFKWESLPNARVHEELDYIDLFATADAMITDCVSFKAEYLFANKPGLILKKPKINYTGYKGKVTDAWYVENGNNFEKITEFIEEVVVKNNDYLKEKREKIFNENFNYNLGNASKTIFEYIKNELI